MNITYAEKKLNIAQGTKEEAIRKHPDWILQTWDFGNGEWVMVQPADILIDGVSHRDFVLELYKQKEIDKDLFEIFKKDVFSGKVALPDRESEYAEKDIEEELEL